MRLAYCYHCKTLSKLADYLGPSADDRLLQDWIDRHMHGIPIDRHPGGRIFPMGEPELAIAPNLTLLSEREQEIDRDLFERAAVETVKAVLAQQQHDVLVEFRDELKEDAVKCFNKHRRPTACVDYHASHKKLGGRGQKDDELAYLCTYCPVESVVTVRKRAQRGDYR